MAASRGGVDQGLPPAVAERLCAVTLLGSVGCSAFGAMTTVCDVRVAGAMPVRGARMLALAAIAVGIVVFDSRRRLVGCCLHAHTSVSIVAAALLRGLSPVELVNYISS